MGRHSYWNKRAQTYKSLDLISNNRLPYIVATVIRHFQLNDHFIVDFGCGPGKMARFLRDYFRHSTVTGFDISQKMIEKAIYLQRDKLAFFCKDLFDEEFNLYTNGTPTACIFSLVIHHLLNGTDLDALKLGYEILAPNGGIVVAEAIPPEEDIFDEYAEIFKWKEERNCYTTTSLVSMLRMAGFTGVRSLEYKFKLSLKNWLNDTTLTESIRNLIYDLHVNSSARFKRAYNMTSLENGDYLLTCKMCIASGVKKYF